MKFEKAIPYRIQIDPTINGGFIVTVGCSVTLAYGDLKQLRKASDEYFADPKKIMDEYKKFRHDQKAEVGAEGAQRQTAGAPAPPYHPGQVLGPGMGGPVGGEPIPVGAAGGRRE